MTRGQRSRWAGQVLVAGALSGAVFAGAVPDALAQADPVFDPADAANLARLLAEATAAQDVCYGWTVHVDDRETGSQAQSTGSNFGPGRSLDSAGSSCRYRVEFTADLLYTRSSADSEDSARWSLTSSPPDGPGTDDLDRLELFDEDDLVGADPDVAVARAIAALPQLAAQAGIASPLSAEPASNAPSDVGSLSDDPGSDYLRRAGALLALGAVLLVGGVAFGAFALRRSRSRPDPAPPHTPLPSPPDPPPPPAPPPAGH